MTLKKQELDGDLVFVIPSFFSPAECSQLVAYSEALGYRDAPITTAVGFAMRKDVRDNLRVMSDDTVLAAHLYMRLEPFMPKNCGGWQVCGLNERLRFYRYDAGNQFRPHFDSYFSRSAVEKSLFTFMIYLNSEFAGRETRFYDDDSRPRFSVTPETGMAIVFWHDQMHEGATVLEGRKYVVRSDVMYRRTNEAVIE